jgi:hypothetical protein
MNPAEAVIIASILSEVDGGCIACARDVAKSMQQAIPEYNWIGLVAAAGDWDIEYFEGQP